MQRIMSFLGAGLLLLAATTARQDAVTTAPSNTPVVTVPTSAQSCSPVSCNTTGCVQSCYRPHYWGYRTFWHGAATGLRLPTPRLVPRLPLVASQSVQRSTVGQATRVPGLPP